MLASEMEKAVSNHNGGQVKSSELAYKLFVDLPDDGSGRMCQYARVAEQLADLLGRPFTAKYISKLASEGRWIDRMRARDSAEVIYRDVVKGLDPLPPDVEPTDEVIGQRLDDTRDGVLGFYENMVGKTKRFFEMTNPKDWTVQEGLQAAKITMQVGTGIVELSNAIDELKIRKSKEASKGITLSPDPSQSGPSVLNGVDDTIDNIRRRYAAARQAAEEL